MKVVFILLKGNSGSDVYFRILKKSLNQHTNIKSELFFLPSWLEKIPFLIPFYLRKIDLTNFNIIHTNVEFAHFFEIKGKKLITTVHHINFDKNYQKYTSIFQKIFHYIWLKPNIKISLKKADLNIAVSDFTKNSCKKFFIGDYKIKTIYNGIDLESFGKIDFKKEENNKIRLLFIGNQSKRKGWDLVVEIMKKLENKYELYYTGLRDNKNKEFEKYNMFCLGRLSQNDLIKEYNKADVFLFPSRLEGFGYSLVEAIACGTPVVTTNYSAMPEIVKNGVNGYLCEMNNIDDFINKIELVQKTKFDYNKMRESIEKFNLQNLAKKYEEVYTK